MVESSKILTVSYGTFSCTLEGFDDSFGTMKAIAEYFRDLAADDRYFGAEPPAPDVQMLAKIAEREITRRVDARTEDGGIVLRAQEERAAPTMPPALAQPDPVQAAAAAVVSRAEPAADTTHSLKQEFETAQLDATASDLEPVAGPEAEDHVSSPLVVSGQATPLRAAPDVDEPENTHPDAESVAAKLQRIRAVVGGNSAPSEADYTEDQHVPDMPDIADHGDAGYVTDGLPDVVQTDVAQPDVAPSGSDLAALDTTADDPDQMTDFEDETPEITSEPIVEPILEPAPEAVDPIAEEPAAELQEDIIEDEAHAEADDDNGDDDDAMLSNLALKLAQPAVQDAQAEVEVDIDVEVEVEVEIAAEAEAETRIDAAAQAEVEPEAAAEVEVEAEKPAIRAQVLRLRKSDIAAPAVDPVVDPGADAFAFADADLEEEAYDDDQDIADVAALDGIDDFDIAPVAEQSSLSEEDEADLMEELAEVERDFAPQTDDDAQADIIDDRAEPQNSVQAKARDILPETDDGMMSRIMDQTDQELSEPEGSRRRNAIAQLKAAVAATEAARQLGDQSDKAEKAEDAFRDDLKDVVRPKRPARPEKPAERSARPRPAPLKLVASQRIDTPETAPEAPVAPRRVATAAEVVSPSSASNFAEFAENMGATELPDLLEAAAAYTAFVEGSEDFSRPQIMKKVQSSSDVEFSREDGLRSFGTLLRQGRISKVRNGRFQVSDETRFRPDTMAG